MPESRLLLVLALAAVLPVAWWAWSRFYIYPRTFRLEYPSSEAVAIGQSTIQVRIQVRYPLNVQGFNLRFTERDGSDVPVSTVRIRSVQDQVESTAKWFWNHDDHCGGRNCGYSRITRKGRKESLEFLLDVEARREWEGYLSFTSYDKAGARSGVRKKFVAGLRSRVSSTNR